MGTLLSMRYSTLRSLVGVVFLLAPAACTVDVDDYTFRSGGGGLTGDGDGDGDGDGGGDGDGDISRINRLKTMARQRVEGEWATECLEGASDLDPGFQYVYTLEDETVRLDMFAFLSDCSVPLWVQSIEAVFTVDDVGPVEDSFVLKLFITNREIMLLEPEAAEEANSAGLFGMRDWEAGVWVDLLGVTDGEGTALDRDDIAYVVFVFLEGNQAIGASLPTVGAVPTEVLADPFEASDGSLAAENL